MARHACQRGEQIIVRANGDKLPLCRRVQRGIGTLLVEHQGGQQIGFGDNGKAVITVDQHAVHAMLLERRHRIPQGGIRCHNQWLAHALIHPRQHEAGQGDAPFPSLRQALTFFRQRLAEKTAELRLTVAQLQKQGGGDKMAEGLLLGAKPVTAFAVEYTDSSEQITGGIHPHLASPVRCLHIQLCHAALVNHINVVTGAGRFQDNIPGFVIGQICPLMQAMPARCSQQAERILIKFLFNHGGGPVSEKVKVQSVKARRWRGSNRNAVPAFKL